MGRGGGAEGLLEAGTEVVDEATLADLLAFAGVRSVAARAGVQPGTVAYHFPNPAGGRKPNRALADALARHALFAKGLPVPTRVAQALLDEVDRLRQGDLAALRRLALASAEDLLTLEAPDRRVSQTAYHICLAAGLADPVAADLLRELHAAFEKEFEVGVGLLAEVTGRRFVDGFDAAAYARVLSALAGGFLARQRFDPTPDPPALLGDVALRLFQATSARFGGEDWPVPEEMVPAADGTPLDRSERGRITSAARALYGEFGDWGEVTVAAVAERAGVGPEAVCHHFPDRGALAATVVGGFGPPLRDALEADRHLELPLILWRHLQRLVELARDHRALVADFLVAVLRWAVAHATVEYDNPCDPRAMAALPTILVRVLYDHHDELRPELTVDEAGALSFSALVVDTALQRALTEPRRTSAQLADELVAVFLDGSRLRPPHTERSS